MNRGDYQDDKRASAICLIGALLQTGIALLMLVSAQYSGEHAATTAAVFFGSGVIVWVTLLFTYDQSRRAKLESLEAEQLASSGGVSASAFESAGDDLKVSARRHAFTQRWVVPSMGLVFAAILIISGVLRLRSWNAISAPESFTYNTNLVGASLAIGLSIAVVGFVFARFVSGMGKVPAWANLRAGAAQSVAISIIGLLICIGAFVELALGQLAFKTIVPSVIPIIMIVIGSEVVLNLILDVYRPRKPGEDPRPAFDSRLLGLLAAPDRIAASIGDAVNYQFGVDVTGTWFYQLLSKFVIVLVLIGMLLGWMLSTLVVVEPHERGLILTNGRISKPIFSFGEQGEGDVGPGLHIKAPWPFGTYETPVSISARAGEDREVRTTTGVRVLHLASNPPNKDEDGPIIWTESHARGERLNIVQPIGDELDNQGDAVGENRRDLSLVVAEVPMHYVVRDVKLFDQFAGPGQREEFLRVIGRRVVTNYLGEHRLDQIIESERAVMPRELRQRLNDAYMQLNDGAGPGIEILFVGLQGVHPPIKVAPSFERVIEARQNRESSIEDARRQQITLLTEIAGSVELAEQIVDEIDVLEQRRRAGETPEQLVEAELSVQRLLEQAGGEAGERLLTAGAERWQRHMSERGKAQLLVGQQLAYEAAPNLYRSRAYFDALLASIRDARVYVTPGDLESLRVRIDLIDAERGAAVFDDQAGAEFNQ